MPGPTADSDRDRTVHPAAAGRRASRSPSAACEPPAHSASRSPCDRAPCVISAFDTTPSAIASPPCRPYRWITHVPSRVPRPPVASRAALQFSGQNVFDRGVLKGQLRVHALELRVLRLELLHSLELRDAHPTVLRSPVEVGCTADPVLPRQLAQCYAGFAFLQDRDDL